MEIVLKNEILCVLPLYFSHVQWIHTVFFYYLFRHFCKHLLRMKTHQLNLWSNANVT